MRRKNDAYHTPEWATRQLLNRIHIKGTVLEVCAGENHITNDLLATEADIYTNDIDNTHWHGYHFDAANLSAWPARRFDWVVTNPPFNKAFDILVNSLASASNVALLLRLSFLELVEIDGIPDLLGSGSYRLNPHAALSGQSLQGKDIGWISYSHLHCLARYSQGYGSVFPGYRLGNQLQCLRLGHLSQ